MGIDSVRSSRSRHERYGKSMGGALLGKAPSELLPHASVVHGSTLRWLGIHRWGSLGEIPRCSGPEPHAFAAHGLDPPQIGRLWVLSKSSGEPLDSGGRALAGITLGRDTGGSVDVRSLFSPPRRACSNGRASNRRARWICAGHLRGGVVRVRPPGSERFASAASGHQSAGIPTLGCSL